MGDEIDISRGGALAVDTEELYEVVRRLRILGRDLDLVARELRSVAVSGAGSVPGLGDLGGLGPSAGRVDAVEEALETVVRGVELMAEAYELVELRARAEALQATDPGEAAALRRDAETRAERRPDADAAAASLLAQWRESRFDGFTEQTGWAGVIFPAGGHWGQREQSWLASLWLMAIGAVGVGVVPGGEALTPRPHTVRIAPTPVPPPSGPPTGLADVVSRFPTTEGAQVRVEAYAMPDGTRRFAAYIAGTQSILDPSEPWDMASNAQMYASRAEADSYQAVLDALRIAGARPGDALDLAGHSQGGMIAQLIARSGEYDVRSVIALGPPIEAELPESVLSVVVRHTDDLVSSLAAGGSPQGTGAPDSIVVERIGDPEQGLHDILLRTHLLDAYAGTAELVDASGDPRVGALRERLAERAGATEIVVADYRVWRP
ncbi:hypothetical protein J2Y69_003470 [Microbacterium resistens]|uniref:Alpha/beta hydrolase n=1 Tax=Microbacterium resistens TaxID=156977 RepID=A0ABU1SGV4_9MICO|nr:hypothetical protein [Microbacterium resistens]MDR6868844.1 hypothetical protein [Microbacterium resistens]